MKSKIFSFIGTVTALALAVVGCGPTHYHNYNNGYNPPVYHHYSTGFTPTPVVIHHYSSGFNNYGSTVHVHHYGGYRGYRNSSRRTVVHHYH